MTTSTTGPVRGRQSWSPSLGSDVAGHLTVTPGGKSSHVQYPGSRVVSSSYFGRSVSRDRCDSDTLSSTRLINGISLHQTSEDTVKTKVIQILKSFRFI